MQSAALVQRSIAEVGDDMKTQRASRVVLRATVARWRIDHTRVRAAKQKNAPWRREPEPAGGDLNSRFRRPGSVLWTERPFWECPHLEILQ